MDRLETQTPSLSVRNRLVGQRAAYEADWCKALELAQAQCQHLKVAHWNGHDALRLSPSHPLRVCTDCGLEEEGGWWCDSPDCTHWHGKNNYNQSEALLGPREGRTITSKTWGEIQAIRVG
jgi:hypothetical protein